MAENRSPNFPSHTVEWRDSGKEPKVAPDPHYPHGKDVSDNLMGTCCRVELPYPAKRIGIYLITCNVCGLKVGVTTAGRPDDPRSVTMSCKGTLQ